jgi:hypothetical protein
VRGGSDGRKNTCAYKNGVMYVMDSLKDASTNVPSSNQINLLSYEEFEQTYKEDWLCICFACCGEK